MSSPSRLLFLILVMAFFVRLLPLNFPVFTFEEARIAHRGYMLVTQGGDELGRSFPILFNSANDYQLPLVSYITALSELIFGKNDFAVRIPFILIGVMLVWVIYYASRFFSTNLYFNLACALLISFSPPLVFLSKVPNEVLPLTLIFVLLFYMLINHYKLIKVILIMILAMLTSKFSWFILLPFVSITLYLGADKISKKEKITILGLTAVLILITFILFLNVPQSKRSLLENNFPIFSEITIKNGIEKMRVQGNASNWPPIVEKILFNKSEYLNVGILHWISHFNPGIYFGQLDSSGRINFSFIGAWSKILIIPMFSGLFFLSKLNRRKAFLLFSYFAILTFPVIFMYPKMELGLVVVTLPFLAIIMALGLAGLNKKLTFFIICLMVLELLVNSVNLSQERRNTNTLRPSWMVGIVKEVYGSSKYTKTYVSDDLVSDIVPFIQWHTPLSINTENIPFPYKYRQYKLENITIIGSDQGFTYCGSDEDVNFYVSNRDLKKTYDILPNKAEKVYSDSLGEEKAYNIGGRVCLSKNMR